jgi:lysophospholipase L1-like esterase
MKARVLVLAALLASSASADMLDDFHSSPGTLQPLSRAIPGRRIMVIGDSIQAGTNLVRDTSQATWRLQKSANVVIHNFATPGATMADAELLPGMFLLGMNHAVEAVRLLSGFFGMYGVIINLGNNDWGQPLITRDAFGSAYGAFLDEIPQSLKVACMSPTWTSTEGMLNQEGFTRADFRQTIKEVCTARNLPYIDGLAAIPNSPAYFVDGLHPNDKGHRVMATFLLKQLKALGWLS